MKEYGQRFYVSDDGYSEQRSRVSDKSVYDQGLYKHSENKKPYIVDDYQDMEYRFDQPDTKPYVPPDTPIHTIPDVPWIYPEVPTVDPVKIPSMPYHIVFACWNNNMCYCPGQTKCYNPDCNWKIVSVSGNGVSLHGGQVCIDAEEGQTGSVVMKIKMEANFNYDGSKKKVSGTSLKTVSKCKKCQEPCDSSATISYTTVQMSVGETQLLQAHVDGGLSTGTYGWSLSGGGELSSEKGSSTIYTAPDTNKNCEDNPTLSLSCDGFIIDSVSIAVSSPDTSSNIAGQVWFGKTCDDEWHVCYVSTYRFYCDGDSYYGSGFTPTCTVGRSDSSCAACYSNPGLSGCYAGGRSINEGLASSPEDLRTSVDKENGCCPAQLL